MLRIGINARQEDLNRELEAVRQSASLLLQRRKATAITLRKLSESANQLEENQIGELKRQLKVMNTNTCPYYDFLLSILLVIGKLMKLLDLSIDFMVTLMMFYLQS